MTPPVMESRLFETKPRLTQWGLQFAMSSCDGSISTTVSIPKEVVYIKTVNNAMKCHLTSVRERR
jgi:hypothetical protein